MRGYGGCCALAFCLLGLGLPTGACGLGSLSFKTAPALPTLPTVTLAGGAQTTTTAMTNFAVKEPILEGNGWNVTVAGQSETGKSAVFAQYCPETAGCGSTPFGYVTPGLTLPAHSLTLNTTGASFSGGSGTAPTFKCSSGCYIDSASAEKIVSLASGGLGGNTWSTSGFSATSLSLSTSTLLRALPAKEVYAVNVVWTLSTGP